MSTLCVVLSVVAAFSTHTFLLRARESATDFESSLAQFHKTEDMWPKGMKPFRAAILGASGNVGRSLVRQLDLLPACTSITLVNRREIDIEASDKVTQHTVDMDRLEDASLPLLQDTDVVFVTMGVGKPSKSTAEVLQRVDVELPTAFARAAKHAGVSHASLLTAVGADINAQPSRWTGTSAGGGLYNMHKGQVEHNFEQQNFESLGVFRPSTLVGNSNTPGFISRIAPSLDFLLPARFQSIHIDQLAGAMVADAIDNLSNDEKKSSTIFEGKSMFDRVKKA